MIFDGYFKILCLVATLIAFSLAVTMFKSCNESLAITECAQKCAGSVECISACGEAIRGTSR